MRTDAMKRLLTKEPLINDSDFLPILYETMWDSDYLETKMKEKYRLSMLASVFLLKMLPGKNYSQHKQQCKNETRLTRNFEQYYETNMIGNSRHWPVPIVYIILRWLQ